MLCRFLTAYFLFASSQELDLDVGVEGDLDASTFDFEEDILLLQVDLKLSRGILQTGLNGSLVSEGFHASESKALDNMALLSEISFRSEAEGGVMFGPKTSAALFLLSSCTFGLLCLCGAKPFITAPYPVRNIQSRMKVHDKTLNKTCAMKVPGHQGIRKCLKRRTRARK